jgi:hypothetical protein
MWEQITRVDIERSKRRLATRRIETLTRHAEELKGLDADQADIDKFERLIAAFASKYLISSASASSPTTASEKTTDVAASTEPPAADASSQLTDFGAPLRRLVRG